MKVYLVFGRDFEDSFRGILQAFASKEKAINFAVKHFKCSEDIVLERFIEEVDVE
jgi:hypothetical protein